jgi:hypothetical protein
MATRVVSKNRHPQDELSELWNVILWRQKELERAGYPATDAVWLSARPDVDLHVACDLLKAGATVEQALRIMF